MKERFIGIHLDFFGFLASGLCAIHCAVLPAVLAFGALSSLSWLGNPQIELIFICISVVLASFSLVQSYFRVHRRALPLLVVGLGFALILGSRFSGEFAHHALTTIGGIAIATAHLMNWRFLR